MIGISAGDSRLSGERDEYNGDVVGVHLDAFLVEAGGRLELGVRTSVGWSAADMNPSAFPGSLSGFTPSVDSTDLTGEAVVRWVLGESSVRPFVEGFAGGRYSEGDGVLAIPNYGLVDGDYVAMGPTYGLGMGVGIAVAEQQEIVLGGMVRWGKLDIDSDPVPVGTDLDVRELLFVAAYAWRW